MDDKTIAIINALAQKLGTTAEYLFAVLVRQAPIDGMTRLAILLGFVAAAVYLVRLVRAKTKVPPATEADPYPRAEWRDEMAVGIAWLATAFFTGVCALAAACELPGIAAAFFNPEYWALKQILRLI